jgi:hypothetical protein
VSWWGPQNIDFSKGRSFLMVKYSSELKIKAVIHSERGFVNRFQRKYQNTVYYNQVKLNAVNLYLTSEKFYQEVVDQFCIATDNCVKYLISYSNNLDTYEFTLPPMMVNLIHFIG